MRTFSTTKKENKMSQSNEERKNENVSKILSKSCLLVNFYKYLPKNHSHVGLKLAATCRIEKDEKWYTVLYSVRRRKWAKLCICKMLSFVREIKQKIYTFSSVSKHGTNIRFYDRHFFQSVCVSVAICVKTSIKLPISCLYTIIHRHTFTHAFQRAHTLSVMI